MQRRTRQAVSAPAGTTTSCWSALRTSIATELEPHLAHSHFGKGRGHDWIISGETEQPFRDVAPNNEPDQLRLLAPQGEFVGQERSDAAELSACHWTLPNLRTRTVVRDVIVNEKRRLIGAHAGSGDAALQGRALGMVGQPRRGEDGRVLVIVTLTDFDPSGRQPRSRGSCAPSRSSFPVSSIA